MSDRRALFGPHAVLHRHRRTSAVRPSSKENEMKPSSKQVNGIAGGQGRSAEEVSMSAEAALVAIMTAGVIALIVALGHIAGWLS